MMKNKNLDYYLNLPYQIITKKLSDKEGGGYLASYKDYPYIMGDGESRLEAIKDAKKAFSGAIELMLEKGDYIKEPRSKEAKVKLSITLPKHLVEAIDKLSSNRSRFLSDCINENLAIKSYVNKTTTKKPNALST